MSRSISSSDTTSKLFMLNKERYVTFDKFKNDLWAKLKAKLNKRFVDSMTLSPSVVWTQIQSFLKGSIEVVIDNKFELLTEEQYFDMSMFPRDRCKLTLQQRKEAFTLFETYQALLVEMKLWDDGDKVLDILKRFGADIYSNHYSFDHPMRYDKVYIDEIQDFTQVETLMFFLATGLDVSSLFMVGDTAQSVEEGRAFRFEEIRSIVHKISNGAQTISKPFKLQTNFRAHTGILEVAASVLDRLFLAFPASSSAHTTDEGVFVGPRPEFYPCSYTTDVDDADNADVELVRNLISVNQRLMILTPESNIDRMNLLLNNPVQLLGVKESKGLEWTDCVILDFFCNIPKSDSKAWKQLLENEKEGRGDLWPQLETQLKQLYVAITRSCNRLIFIETKPSEIATRMFKYWTVRSPLVVRYKPDTETFDLLTADESVKRGLDFVLSATDLESDDNNDYSKMLSWLKRASYYFERAGRIDLIRRVALKEKILLLLLSKKSNEELERYQIENEHKVIGLIHECIMNDMHMEALALMQQLHDDSDSDHDNKSSRYMTELIHKYKIVSSC